MNLYTKLVAQETRAFAGTLDRLERKRKAILRAERMAKKINKAGLVASVEADSYHSPVIVLQIPIDRLQFIEVITATVANVLDRTVVANGEDFMVLQGAEETEFSGQRLLIEAI